MDWKDLLILLAVWSAMSVPFGMLIGRAIAHASRFDVRQDTDEMESEDQKGTAFPPGNPIGA